MILTARAPAKINLSLHILGRRPDGFHDLESLVAFAGSGDLLTLRTGPALSLTITGPTATAAGGGPDNLVLRAAHALAERVPGLGLGAFHLTKRLPVAAGIGGGSSDAAAALRLLAQANGLSSDDRRLTEAAAATGADVPVCLDPHARMMQGTGERLGPALRLPPLPAVLVNPGIGLETRAVFGRMGLAPGEGWGGEPHPDLSGLDVPGLIRALRVARNDMERPAGELAPLIPHLLAMLRETEGCQIVRMSGSGMTCFALYPNCRAAASAAAKMRTLRPAWWIKSTVLR